MYNEYIQRVVQMHSGNLGIGEETPSALLEMKYLCFERVLQSQK